MKIECSACGKKYDPVKKQGICPYCGMHSTEEQMAEAIENERVQSGTVSEVLRGYLNEKLRKEQKISPLRRKGMQLLICLFLVGCMVLVGLWGYGRYKERLEYYRDHRSTEQMETKECRPGDQIVLGGSRVRVTGFRVAEEYQKNVSEGFKIIEVSYSDDGTTEYNRLSDAFICTEKGCTAKCFDRYDIMELTGITEDQYRESDYCDGVFSGKGTPGAEHKILFAVPAAEKEHRLYLFSTTDIYASDKSAEMRYEYVLREEASV
ncbi:MAG: hypothetical protein IKP95_07980 [Ruminococcus sp.]|nr:hypothetical protein [Ruminococcus sp.]